MKELALIIAAVTFVSCGGGSSGSDNFQQAPLAECDVTESEPNNDYSEADFAGTLLPGDFVNLCGRMTTQNSQDWFWFYTPASQAVSIVVDTNFGGFPPKTTPVARIWTNTLGDPDTLYLVGQFVGVPGKLFVQNWHVPVSDNGYFIELHGIGPDTMYHVETWSEGWVYPTSWMQE